MSRALLEADPTILEKKLILPELANGLELESFLPKQEKEEVPWKPVVPFPGVCIKCHTGEGDKLFINLCHTNSIQAPEDISDERLIEILDSEKETGYTIPMSVGDLHVETDKSGNLCSVYDIAINTKFFQKINTNELFKTFIITISMEAIQEKYSINLNMKSPKPYVILKNRKVLGTLRAHRIQQRPVRKPPTALIEEISSTTISPKNKSDKLPEQPKEKNNLKLRICPNKDKAKFLLATVKVNAITGAELNLDIGEDRIVLTRPKKQQKIVDIFHPFSVDQSKAKAFFNTVEQVLKIHLPLISGTTNNSNPKIIFCKEKQQKK